MSEATQNSLVCSGCGTRLVASMRYCPSCYQRVSTGTGFQRHTDSARQIDTTKREDPTVVFSPEAREQIKKQTKLMKVVAICGISFFVLFTIALYSYLPYKRMRAENKKASDRFVQARKDMNMTAEALTRFKRDLGRYPTKDEGIKVLMEPPLTWTDSETSLYKKWSGPYATSVREVDPWGNEYLYEPTPDGKEYKLKAVDPMKEPDKGIRVVVTSND